MIKHQMSNIYPLPVNNNLLKKIGINANINVGKFYHDIFEYNSVKSDIQCLVYLPYLHQEP